MNLKRIIDILLCAGSMIVAAPLMLVIAIILKLESKGPVFYRCKRMGRFGKTFDMLKFRTMVDNADKIDCKLCACSDVRVTPLGKLLRRTKLNELPQLFNVIKGDMSLVGPRPEDPKFVVHFKDKWEIVLSVRPGIVGPNQVISRNEEDLLEHCDDPEAFYVAKLLPHKLDIDVQYVQNNSFWGGMWLLTRGLYVTIFGSGRFLQFFKKIDLLLGLLEDVCLSITAYLLAYIIRFETIVPNYSVMPNLLIIVAINPLLFLGLGLYRRPARFFSLSDLAVIAKAVVLSGTLLMIGNKLLLSSQGHSRTVFLCYFLILMCLMGGTRIMRRLALEKGEMAPNGASALQNAVIYGAGRLGVETAKRLKFEPSTEVKGFVDDNPDLRNQTILGLKVLGRGSDLTFLKSLYDIEKVFIAFKSLRAEELRRVRHHCMQAGLTEILIRSAVPGSETGPFIVRNSFRKIRLSDLLGMKDVSLNAAPLRSFLKGAKVAVDGAGNHLGEHLCRELLNLGVAKLILLEGCPAKLDRINRIVKAFRPHGTMIYTYLVPPGFPSLFLSVLRDHDLTHLICNGSGRPIVNSSLNGTALFLTTFVDTVRKIESAKQRGCQYISFLSPYLKDSLSQNEKALNLLSEHYVVLSGENRKCATRSGVIRLPNVLEDESEVFGLGIGETCESAAEAETDKVAMFTSARYAARIALNTLPLHQQGEIFVETASQAYHLRALVNSYFELLANGNSPGLRHESSRPASPLHREENQHYGCEKTSESDIFALRGHELPNLYGLKTLTELHKDHLDNHDKMLIKEFLSSSYEKFRPLPDTNWVKRKARTESGLLKLPEEICSDVVGTAPGGLSKINRL